RLHPAVVFVVKIEARDRGDAATVDEKNHFARRCLSFELLGVASAYPLPRKELDLLSCVGRHSRDVRDGMPYRENVLITAVIVVVISPVAMVLCYRQTQMYQTGSNHDSKK